MQTRLDDRLLSLEVLDNIQVLYQNEAIDGQTKNSLSSAIKTMIKDHNSRLLLTQLQDLHRTIDVKWKDNLNDLLYLLERNGVK